MRLPVPATAGLRTAECCSPGYSATWSPHGMCRVCLAGHRGTLCQFSNQVTCNGNGKVDEHGTCTCATNAFGADCAIVPTAVPTRAPSTPGPTAQPSTEAGCCPIWQSELDVGCLSFVLQGLCRNDVEVAFLCPCSCCQHSPEPTAPPSSGSPSLAPSATRPTPSPTESPPTLAMAPTWAMCSCTGEPMYTNEIPDTECAAVLFLCESNSGVARACATSCCLMLTCPPNVSRTTAPSQSASPTTFTTSMPTTSTPTSSAPNNPTSSGPTASPSWTCLYTGLILIPDGISTAECQSLVSHSRELCISNANVWLQCSTSCCGAFTPTASPTRSPSTAAPTTGPLTSIPSFAPTRAPSARPSHGPATSRPTQAPTPTPDCDSCGTLDNELSAPDCDLLASSNQCILAAVVRLCERACCADRCLGPRVVPDRRNT